MLRQPVIQGSVDGNSTHLDLFMASYIKVAVKSSFERDKMEYRMQWGVAEVECMSGKAADIRGIVVDV